MEVWIVGVAALVAGVVVGWLLAASRFHRASVALEGRAGSAEALSEDRGRQLQRKEEETAALRAEAAAERTAKVEALTRLEGAGKALAEERQLLASMKQELTDTFNALAAAALKNTSEDFLKLASENMGRLLEATKGKLGEHEKAMDGMIRPLEESLKRYEEHLQTLEGERKKAYGGLEEQLRSLSSTEEGLRKETANLVSALRKPQVRGRWGEMQLRRVAELSGMSAHCDFTEQVSVDTEKGRLRPDMIVHLPMEREVVVDAKVALDAYLAAIEAATEEERRSAMERHARQVRAHMAQLASKDYWAQFDRSPEFVVLFIPGESFLGAALDFDAALLEDGMAKKIVLATPATFIALLKAVAYGWQQEQLACNARAISDLGRELYDRIAVMVGHMNDLGSGLRKANDAFNRAVGSMESRVLPSVRRFRDLGVPAAAEVSSLESVDRVPRSIEQPVPEGEESTAS